VLKELLQITRPIKFLTPKEMQIMIKKNISTQGKPLDMT
jgi:hypothetical protein